MTLSVLQKFILRESYIKDKRINRKIFSRFYNGKNISQKLKVKIITKSLERLVERGLLVAWGERTKEKWFINEIKLTPLGRRLAKKLMGVQASLPFKRSTKF